MAKLTLAALPALSNEILLSLAVLIFFSMTLVWFRFFGERGLIALNSIVIIAANIEVLILVDAFGMEQTLGNVLFACTAIISDILSETRGRQAAKRAINIGLATSATFILISQSWLLYSPNGNDFAFSAITTIFSNTPRILIASLAVYYISQRFDLWVYFKVWDFTTERYGDRKKMLWARENLSTFASQLLNICLFNIFAFAGTYDFKTLVSISVSGYLIYVVTSILDTPFIYLARKIDPNKGKPEID